MIMLKIKDQSGRIGEFRCMELLEIDGVGPKTVEKLLKTLGSVERVRTASDEDLIREVGPATAQRIRQHFEKLLPAR